MVKLNHRNSIALVTIGQRESPIKHRLEYARETLVSDSAEALPSLPSSLWVRFDIRDMLAVHTSALRRKKRHSSQSCRGVDSACSEEICRFCAFGDLALILRFSQDQAYRIQE